MPEPSPLQKSLVEEVTYLRGRVITAYAQVEFILADFSVKLDLKFPFRIRERIRAAKAIGERPEYAVYKPEIDRICDELLVYDEMRNVMAHGFLSLTTDKKDNHEYEFRMYRGTQKGEFELLMIKTNTTRLKAAVQVIDDYVQRAHELFRRIYMERRIEEPKDGVLTEPKEKPA